MADKTKQHMQEEDDVKLVRILGKDIRGDKKVLAGLTDIKGISWSFSNALCGLLKFDREKQIQELTDKEVESLEAFMKDPSVPSFMKNRQKDFDSGDDRHIFGEDIKLRKEFDLKRLRKIKSYRGIRHAAKLPVRGQRTRSNFRKNRRKAGSSGIKKKK